MYHHTCYYGLLLGHIVSCGKGLYRGDVFLNDFRYLLESLIDVIRRQRSNFAVCGLFRGAKLERYADKMREILPMIGWLILLYLVCILI